MSTTPNVFAHPACDQFLAGIDMYATLAAGGYAEVRDEEGAIQFTVPVTIEPLTLVTIVDHGRRQFSAGSKSGREQVKRELLSLIGAQPAQAATA